MLRVSAMMLRVSATQLRVSATQLRVSATWLWLSERMRSASGSQQLACATLPTQASAKLAVGVTTWSKSALCSRSAWKKACVSATRRLLSETRLF